MPKKPKTSPGAAARPAIPWRIRVREDAGFRPLVVSMEGRFLGVVSIDDLVEEAAERCDAEVVPGGVLRQAQYERICLVRGEPVEPQCWLLGRAYPEAPFPSIASMIAPGDKGNSFMRFPVAW